LRDDGRAGFAYYNATANSNATVNINRTGSDGDLIRLFKSGSNVGSIGAKDGDLTIGTNDTGIRFYDGGNAVYPVNASTQAGLDATIDLGRSDGGGTFRFKDLYLSGSAFVDTQLRAGAGSASTPSVSFSADSDSGMYRATTNALGFSTGGAERMRLDSSGNVLIHKTITAASTAGAVFVPNNYLSVANTQTGSTARLLLLNRHSGTGTAVEFRQANAGVGSISVTASATAYNTSSDQRLKENIVDAPSASDDIDAIQVRSFDWKTEGSHQKYGMVAQELNTVAPEAVSTPEDSDDMMGVDYSKLVPMLVKEIQSLRARVAQLETN